MFWTSYFPKEAHQILAQNLGIQYFWFIISLNNNQEFSSHVITFSNIDIDTKLSDRL